MTLTQEQQRVIHTREQLHYIVALLDHGAAEMPHHLRYSLEQWAAELRTYLSGAAQVPFPMRVRQWNQHEEGE